MQAGQKGGLRDFMTDEEQVVYHPSLEVALCAFDAAVRDFAKVRHMSVTKAEIADCLREFGIISTRKVGTVAGVRYSGVFLLGIGLKLSDEVKAYEDTRELQQPKTDEDQVPSAFDAAVRDFAKTRHMTVTNTEIEDYLREFGIVSTWKAGMLSGVRYSGVFLLGIPEATRELQQPKDDPVRDFMTDEDQVVYHPSLEVPRCVFDAAARDFAKVRNMSVTKAEIEDCLREFGIISTRKVGMMSGLSYSGVFILGIGLKLSDEVKAYEATMDDLVWDFQYHPSVRLPRFCKDTPQDRECGLPPQKVGTWHRSQVE